jgi:hypothetical protein
VNRPYSILASETLTNWTVLTEGSTSSSIWRGTDPAAVNRSQRFYRIEPLWYDSYCEFESGPP